VMHVTWQMGMVFSHTALGFFQSALILWEESVHDHGELSTW
jgi:hypothetical protein